MEYDVMIHNADLLIDAFDADHDVIYATGLTLTETEIAADILMARRFSLSASIWGIDSWQQVNGTTG